MSAIIPQSFSLYQLNEHLKRVVSFNMRQPIWVNCEVAEVSNSKGNVFLSLVERADYELKAKAEAMIWRKDLNQINQKVGDSLWSILQIGRQVLLQVQVEFHEYYGLKLIVKDIDPSVTIGQLELQRLQVLKKLQTEKFTELNAQLPSPTVWQRLAVISSSNAAGLQDFFSQLKSNPYQYYFECELFEAAMQGVHLSSEVIKQLQVIEQQKGAFDAIIIVRGGGARLDLMGFDDYDLCVAIATAELPVLTGIGHDIDESIADIVAYQSLKTPTAVADYLIHQMVLFESKIQDFHIRVQHALQQRHQSEQLRLQQIEQSLHLALKTRLANEKELLRNLSTKLSLLSPSSILERGFAAVTNEDGEMIASVNELKKNTSYTLQLADGKVTFTLE